MNLYSYIQTTQHSQVDVQGPNTINTTGPIVSASLAHPVTAARVGIIAGVTVGGTAIVVALHCCPAHSIAPPKTCARNAHRQFSDQSSAPFHWIGSRALHLDGADSASPRERCTLPPVVLESRREESSGDLPNPPLDNANDHTSHQGIRQTSSDPDDLSALERRLES